MALDGIVMSTSELTVRRARPDDATAIADVHVASWRTTYPGIVDQAYIDALSASDRAAAWARRLAAEPATAPDILVAVAGDRIVGFLSGGPSREPFPGYNAELHAIYLLKSVQRRGVGRRLIRDWASLAVARGFHAAIVRVLAANPARFFYESLGAERLQETQLVIGGTAYPELWYGWRRLLDLTT